MYKSGATAIEIIPSILSADFNCLSAELAKIKRAGCTKVHIDIMDGHFVPNITVGPAVIRSIRKTSDLFFVGHLMIEMPERFLKAYKDAGLDGIIIHQEACCAFLSAMRTIRKLGLEVGVALRPKTSFRMIKDVLSLADVLLIMTVEPGFGGQAYLSGMEKKICEAREFIDKNKVACALAVDGGINLRTIPRVVGAGATRLVSGSAVFGGNVVQNIRRLQKAAAQRGGM